MLRFFQLRGSWVQEVASPAAAVVTDAELQMDVKDHWLSVRSGGCAVRFLLPSLCRGPRRSLLWSAKVAAKRMGRCKVSC